MRGAKQVQMLRHRPSRFVRSYLFHFLSYHFETWRCCFCVYKECLCSLLTGENEYVVVFLFPRWPWYCPLSARSSGFTGGTTSGCLVILYELWLACDRKMWRFILTILIIEMIKTPVACSDSKLLEQSKVMYNFDRLLSRRIDCQRVERDGRNCTVEPF